MKAADWLGRLLCGISLLMLSEAHERLFGGQIHGLLGVAIYLCTSGLCNFASIVLADKILNGPISYDMQRLAFCALIVNFFSFIAFMAKNSPSVALLNSTIMVISYVQFARLLWPSNGNPITHHRRVGVLRLLNLQGTRLYLEKEKR
ncbi:MAG: hypothetical protein JO253_08015 [Alphaproteobacteria bacterium]|nr:hypothetical protein [Alphaproteobacteria bacterium]